MERTTFQRITALLLTLVMLVGGSFTTVAAADIGASDDVTIESLRDLLAATSYTEYCDEYYQKDDEGKVVLDANGNPVWTVAPGASDIVIDCLGYDAENTNADVKIEEFGGQQGLYLPETGSVSW